MHVWKHKTQQSGKGRWLNLWLTFLVWLSSCWFDWSRVCIRLLHKGFGSDLDRGSAMPAVHCVRDGLHNCRLPKCVWTELLEHRWNVKSQGFMKISSAMWTSCLFQKQNSQEEQHQESKSADSWRLPCSHTLFLRNSQLDTDTTDE